MVPLTTRRPFKARLTLPQRLGGGSVVFNVARYFTTGTLVVPAGVILCGSIEGPFDDGSGVNPGLTTIAPTLLVTNSSGPFITLNGINAGVTDLLFHYPNQASSSASSPNVYPYTIVANSPGTKVVRFMATNAYNFLDIESGRVIAQDLFIGAYNIGICRHPAFGLCGEPEATLISRACSTASSLTQPTSQALSSPTFR